ncbi:hypothetical protein, partial [Dietzia sp. UCD-THP]|uniref:hypothetical protein n=1 Tax=Dietzia sp. UCD-THP TaxID=1292020 RepID=UPI001EE656C5
VNPRRLSRSSRLQRNSGAVCLVCITDVSSLDATRLDNGIKPCRDAVSQVARVFAAATAK